MARRLPRARICLHISLVVKRKQLFYSIFVRCIVNDNHSGVTVRGMLSTADIWNADVRKKFELHARPDETENNHSDSVF